MKLGRFLCYSAVLGLGWWLCMSWVIKALWPTMDVSALRLGFASAFVLSTVGWSLTGYGLSKSVQHFAGYFVAGVLVKLVLFGVFALTVRGLGLAPLKPYIACLALSFVVVFFSQLVLVARAASARLKELAANPADRNKIDAATH